MKKAAAYAALVLLLLNAFGRFEVVPAATAESTEPLKILRVGLDSKTFNPSKGETVTLNFEITRQAAVEVMIYDRLGREVKRFDLPGLEAGRCSIEWNGCDAGGKQAAGQVFLYVIKASDGRSRTIYNPAKETAGLLVKTHEFSFDAKMGTIEYVLPKTCMIRLRAGLSSGMLARTIFDWQPRTAGRHTYKWDGKDESGLINLLKHPELDLNLTCYTLPANTIIATGPIVPFEPKKKNPAKTKSGQKDDLWAEKGKYFHYRHDPRNCHEPRFEVLFPKAKKTDHQNVPVVSGVTQIRIELEPQDATCLVNKRFEIMLYVDGIFIFEMEEGSSPFTYNWDTRGLRKGPHTLTVNLMSYDGHIGVVSRKVIIGE